MTSASELFHNRRYRFGRNTTDSSFEIVSDLPSPATYRHRSHRGRDFCEPPPLRRHHITHTHRPFSDPFQERDSVRIEVGRQQFESDNVNVSRSRSRDRSRLSPSERLPGAVLLARERLLQRLRSVTLSTSRRSNRSSSSNQRNNVVTSNDFRLADATDWEAVLSTEWLAAFTPLTESVNHNITKRSPGLTQESINCLHVEIFNEPKEDDTSKALRECSICLESFVEGDELAYLPCTHRYHFSCLGPWVRTCGDCPYCRGVINVSNGGK